MNRIMTRRTYIITMLLIFLGALVVDAFQVPVPYKETPRDAEKRQAALDHAKALIEKAKDAPDDQKTIILGKALYACEEVQWGGLDDLFVESLVLYIEVLIKLGQPENARRLAVAYKNELDYVSEVMASRGVPEKALPANRVDRLLKSLENDRGNKPMPTREE